jgi:hypothetical protein
MSIYLLQFFDGGALECYLTHDQFTRFNYGCEEYTENILDTSGQTHQINTQDIRHITIMHKTAM